MACKAGPRRGGGGVDVGGGPLWPPVAGACLFAQGKHLPLRAASRPPSPRAQRRLPPARPACPTIPPHASPPVNRKPYPSDLTDAEWNTLEPLIPHFTPHSPSLASTLDTARTQSTAPVALQEHAANQQMDRRN